MGVGLMNSLMHTGSFAGGINWAKAEDVGLALLVSPVVGFVFTALLFLLTKLRMLHQAGTLFRTAARQSAAAVGSRNPLPDLHRS